MVQASIKALIADCRQKAECPVVIIHFSEVPYVIHERLTTIRLKKEAFLSGEELRKKYERRIMTPLDLLIYRPAGKDFRRLLHDNPDLRTAVMDHAFPGKLF